MTSMLGFGSIIKLIPYDDMRMREVKCMWAVLAIWEGLFFSSPSNGIFGVQK